MDGRYCSNIFSLNYISPLCIYKFFVTIAEVDLQNDDAENLETLTLTVGEPNNLIEGTCVCVFYTLTGSVYILSL